MTPGAAGWLAVPGRFSGTGRTAARRWLAGLALALIVAAVVGRTDVPSPELLHDALVAAMRHGSGYYDALRDLLRAEPAAIVPPPALTVVGAALPAWAMTLAVAAALTLVLAAGSARLPTLFARSAATIVVLVLLIAGVIAGALLWDAAPHAGWAAILSALALLTRSRERWGAACALGCAAAIVDPAALVTVAIMTMFALLDGSAREARGWLLAALVAGVVLGCHVWAIAAYGSWPNELSLATGAAARLVGTAFPGLSPWLATPALVLSAFGWGALSHPVGVRVLTLMAAGASFDGLLGLHAATLATILVAPGVALAPGAVGDLTRAARDRRRITVTRIVR